MPILEIDGIGRVEVGDEFTRMAPEEQHAFVGQIVDSVGKGVKSSLGGAAPAAAPLPPVADSMGLSSGDMAGDAQANSDIARSIFTGATLGFGPRIIAGAKALVGAGSYDQNLADERAQADAFHKTAGSFDTGMGFLGGAAGALAGGAGLAAAGVRAALPASLAGKVATGAGVGGLLGGVQGAAESPDWTDPAKTAKDAAAGAIAGGVAGVAIPLAARGIGASVNAARDLISPSAPESVSRASYGLLARNLTADGLPAVEQRLQTLGPDAMLPDAGSSMLGLAQGVGTRPGPGRSTLTDALEQRNAGTNARVQDLVSSTLGPDQSARAADLSLKADRSAEHAVLPSVFENAPPVDATGVLATIGQKLNKAVGPERAALLKARDYLTETNPQGALVPVSDAERLNNAKIALRTLVEGGDPTLGVVPGALNKKDGATKAIIGQLDDALRGQVPGYADAMDKSSALARQISALKEGTQVLRNGPTSPHPDDFATSFPALEPAVQDATRIGMLSDIHGTLGRRANDLQALSGKLQGPNGYNAQNITTAFGNDAGQALQSGVEREAAFRDTRNKIVQGSQTAQRTAAADMLADKPPLQMPLVNPNMTTLGLLAAGAKKAATTGMGLLARSNNAARDAELGGLLALQGPERDALLGSLKAALEREALRNQTGQTIGNAIAVPGGLLSYDASRKRLRASR